LRRKGDVRNWLVRVRAGLAIKGAEQLRVEG